MKEWFIENIVTVIATIFGGGSLWGFITERKKRKIEERSLSTDALKKMQEAYDRFTEDAMQRYEALKKEVQELREKLAVVTKQLDNETKLYEQVKQQLEDCLDDKS